VAQACELAIASLMPSLSESKLTLELAQSCVAAGAPSLTCALNRMVTLAPMAIAPFQSICDALVIAQTPLLAVQVLDSAIKFAGSWAVNSAPGLSPCMRLPVLANLASMETMLPAPVQAAGSVNVNETLV